MSSERYNGLAPQVPAGSGVNIAATGSPIDTPLTQPRSGPVRYELIDRDGIIVGNMYASASAAAYDAKLRWPDQEQDEDRAGKGWDIEAVGVGL